MTDESLKDAVIEAALDAQSQLQYLIEKNIIATALPRSKIIKLLEALNNYKK